MAEVQLQFKERGPLAAWLKDQPREVSVVLAARAALRVFPLLSANIGEDADRFATAAEVLIFPTVWAVSVAWVAARYGIQAQLIEAGDSASDAADIAGKSLDLSSPRDSGPAFAAADAAAAVAAEEGEDAGIAADAADAAARAQPGLASVAISIWESVSFDASRLAAHEPSEQLASQPLWPTETPAWAREHWNSLKRKMLESDAQWQVFTDWYEARQRGGQTWPDLTPEQNEELDVAIALCPTSFGGGARRR